MKHIIFSGAPSEKSSPFCKKNEEICAAWEDYILSKNGTLMGKYNAFSLIVKGKLFNCWEIEIKKSTMPGGSLLLSTEFQNLYFHVQLKKRITADESEYFIFRRRKTFDHLRRLFCLRSRQVELFDNYYLEYENGFTGLYKELNVILSKAIKLQQVKTFGLIEGEIEVTFEANTSDLGMIDKILAL